MAGATIGGMDGDEAVRELAAVLDGHRWSELPALLHEEFSCRLVHTGEVFDRDGWVRLNADYPGFQRFLLQDVVAEGDRAAARAHVTGESGGQVRHFEVALFVSVRDGLIVDDVEVWTDVGQSPPPDARDTPTPGASNSG